MFDEKNYPRILGFTVIIVFLTSFTSSILRSSIVGSVFDPIETAQSLSNISNNEALFRLAILVEMLTSIFIVVLAIIFYKTLKEKNKIFSQIALGWWLVEAMTLAISQVAYLSLIPLSKDFMDAGAPANSVYLTVGSFLLMGLYGETYLIHNLFFALGGILWFYLLYKSKTVPSILSAYGFITISLFSINLFRLLLIPDLLPDLSIFMSIPYLPFEPILGLWLLIKGSSQK